MSEYLRSKDRDITVNYTKAPRQLWQSYTKLPGFNGKHAILYIILLDYFNDDYGYSFPKIKDLELATGWSENTIISHIEMLKRYELVEPIRAGNNRYRLKLPLDEPEFSARFGDLLGEHEAREERLRERAQAEKKRLQEVAAEKFDEYF